MKIYLNSVKKKLQKIITNVKVFKGAGGRK
jgi:hypothetical protein